MNATNVTSSSSEELNKVVEDTFFKHLIKVILLLIAVCILLYTSIYLVRNFSDIKKVFGPPKALTQKELATVQDTFMKTFRPGCPLTTKSVFTFKSGAELSGYFATCAKEMPERTYTASVIRGRDVILETVAERKQVIPVVTIYNKVLDISSSTLFMNALGEAQALRQTEIKSMSKKELDEANSLKSYFGTAGSYIVLYQVLEEGPYFDTTSMTVTERSVTASSTKK